jgi:beta-lactamase regulating signal transducer with metallopeptidase domain
VNLHTIVSGETSMEANVVRQLISTGPAQLLIASIWQGLLLTGFAWVCLALAPRLGISLRASTRFTLWLIVFLLVALLPCFAIVRGVLGGEPLAVSPASQADFALHLNIGWAYALEGLWVLTSLFSLARLIANAKQMRTLWRTSTQIPFPALDVELQSIVVRRGSRPVELRLSDSVDAPSVVGFFQPAIVMPRALWGELDPADRKQIILHEVAHLDRGDDWTNLLQKLLRAVCPLNPALFLAERNLCREREQACDDAVLDAAGNARSYATCLTKLAETRLVKRAASLAPGLWRRHSELAGRVENILHRRPNLGPLFSRGLVAASLLITLSAALVLQRCPELVSFANSDAFTAEATAPGAGSPAATLVRARVQNSEQARYQDAVFHPVMNDRAVMPLKQATSPKPHAAVRHTYAPGSSLRFVQLRAVEDEDGGVTLILFTVEVPQTSASHGGPRQAISSTLYVPNSWIAFQI